MLDYDDAIEKGFIIGGLIGLLAGEITNNFFMPYDPQNIDLGIFKYFIDVTLITSGGGIGICMEGLYYLHKSRYDK